MTRHEESLGKMQAGSVLQPKPYTVAELRSEIISIERHQALLQRQHTTLERQLIDLLCESPPEVSPSQSDETASGCQAPA